MANWQTFGHQAIKDLLGRQLADGRLAQAYLFVGPDGVGKKSLALELAGMILPAENLSSHPDFMLLDAADGEITMELALEFISRLGLKPFVAKRKVALINNAENLNVQSSNALLKTLEEPASDTVIILVSSGGRILPTIVSRCQVLRFAAFNKQRLGELAKNSKWEASPEVLELCFGSPARLKRLVGDKDFFSAQQEEIIFFRKLKAAPTGEKLAAIADLAETGDGELKQRLILWLNWQVRELGLRPGEFAKTRALLEALRGLDQNKNKKLLLQSLMLKI